MRRKKRRGCADMMGGGGGLCEWGAVGFVWGCGREFCLSGASHNMLF
jgi:hypothetical protein